MAARWDDDSLWVTAAPVAAAAPAKPKAAVRWDDDALWGGAADFGNVASTARSTAPDWKPRLNQRPEDVKSLIASGLASGEIDYDSLDPQAAQGQYRTRQKDWMARLPVVASRTGQAYDYGALDQLGILDQKALASRFRAASGEGELQGTVWKNEAESIADAFDIASLRKAADRLKETYPDLEHQSGRPSKVLEKARQTYYPDVDPEHFARLLGAKPLRETGGKLFEDAAGEKVPMGEALTRAFVGGATQLYAAPSYLVNDLAGDAEGLAQDAAVLGAIEAETGESMHGRGLLGKAAIAGSQSLPAMLAPVGTGLGARLSAKGLEGAAATQAAKAAGRRAAAEMGASVYPVEFAAARRDGESAPTAALGAALNTAAEIIPEAGVIGRAFEPATTAGRGVLARGRRALETVAGESASEVLSESGGIATDTLLYGRDAGDVGERLAIAGLAGAGIGTVPGALGALTLRPAVPAIQTGQPEVDTGAAAARRLIEAADAEAAASQPPPAAATIPDLTQAPAGQPDALDDLLRAQEAITAEDAAREGQRAESPIPQPAPVFQAPDPGLDPADAGLPGPAADLPGPDAGPVVSVPDAGTAQAGAPEAPATGPRVRGAAGRAFTGAGEAVDFDYAVVESDDLVPSNDAGGRVNPRYPRELQPRDRTTPESRASVAVIAKNLNPERLGESQDIVNGAPLVGDDLVVESGNGRVMALQSADQDRQGAYRQWIEANAGRFGVDAEAVRGMRSPVLVRVRRGELAPAERARLGREGNRATTLGMSPTEKAKADAALVTDDMMAAWAPSEDGDPLSASNQPFIRQFLSGLGANESAELSSNGRLTKQAADRMQAAVFAKAYGDPRLINLFASEADPQIKNVLTALSRGAGAFARAKAKGAEEAGLDLSANLAEAASLMLDAKDKGMTLRALMDQGDMFGSGRDPVSTSLALFFADNARAPRRMGDLIQSVGGLVEKELQARTSGDMFGRQDASRAEILDAAQAAAAEQPARQTALLSQGRNDRAGDGEGQPVAGGRAAAGDAAGNGEAAGEVAPAADNLDAPNFGMPEPAKTLPDGHELLVEHDTDNSPERMAMRAALVEQRFAGKQSVASGTKPVVIVLGGGGASGKGTVLKLLRKKGKLPQGAVELDPDSFKTGDAKHGLDGIPEYGPIVAAGDSRAAAVTHEESSRLYKEALARGVRGRYNLVLDRTMSDPVKGVQELRALKDAGYEIRFIGVTADIESAIKRAVTRANGPEKRYVPLKQLIKAHRGFSRAIAEYRSLVDEFALYDNNVEKGQDPVLIAFTAKGDRIAVTDRARYNSFAAKGDLNESAGTYRELRTPATDERVDAGTARGDDRAGRLGGSDRGTGKRSAAPAVVQDAAQERGVAAPKAPPSGGVSASGPATTAAPATVTLDMPKMTASRLADLDIEVEASDGKRSKTVKVNAYKVLRRAMQRLDAINSLMECVRRG